MNFFDRVKSFNRLYGIPTPGLPITSKVEMRDRLKQFMPIIRAEVAEGDDILDGVPWASEVDTLTDLADWYGDIIVYCASEMARHGLPAGDILSIIMDSNDSKRQADGTALFVAGKLQKGPNYWKPEPKIRALIEALQAIPQQEVVNATHQSS